jgi:protein TonB
LFPVSFCFAAFPQVTIPQDATALVVNAPRPEYPVEAQLRRERGSGVFLVRAKIKSGRVTQVIVARTTGYKLLDDAAVKALRHWWFKPGALVTAKSTNFD